MTLQDEFQVIVQITSSWAVYVLEVEVRRETGDPVGSLLLEVRYSFHIELWLVLVGLVETVEYAIAQATEGYLGQIIVPDSFSLGSEAFGWCRIF